MSKTSPMSPKINMSGSKFFFSFCATFSSKIIGSNKFSFQQSNLLFYQNPNPIKFNLQSHTISIKKLHAQIYTQRANSFEPIFTHNFHKTQHIQNLQRILQYNKHNQHTHQENSHQTDPITTTTYLYQT